MKVFTFQFSNSKYKSKPQEDSLQFSEDTFVVADGITRDSLGETEDPLTYPNPSPAKIAADTFTKEFIDYSKEHNLKESFKYGNNKIKKLNEKGNPNPDYLKNDFWACVAAAVKVEGQNIEWCVIGDCKVRIFDKELNTKFETPNSVKVFEKFFFSESNPYLKSFDWKKEESRILVRKEFRNNPDQKSKGEIVSYGALTGEEIAEQFMYIGSENVSDGDLVIIHSDGFERLFENPDFKVHLKKLLEDENKRGFNNWLKELGEKEYEKYGHERTMLLIQV